MPRSRRRAAGRRVYALDAVEHLQLAQRALALGHAPAQVLRSPTAELERVLRAADQRRAPPPVPAIDFADRPQLLELVQRLELDRLREALRQAHARLGVPAFLDDVVSPLLHLVGEAWASGQLRVRHEHATSETIVELCQELARLPAVETPDEPPPVTVAATLPDEHHAIGMHFCQLVLRSLGWRVFLAGHDLPVLELAELRRELGARVVLISVSASATPELTLRQLKTLRAALPRRVELLLGGVGASCVDLGGTEVVPNMRGLAAWARAKTTAKPT